MLRYLDCNKATKSRSIKKIDFENCYQSLALAPAVWNQCKIVVNGNSSHTQVLGRPYAKAVATSSTTEISSTKEMNPIHTPNGRHLKNPNKKEKETNVLQSVHPPASCQTHITCKMENPTKYTFSYQMRNAYLYISYLYLSVCPSISYLYLYAHKEKQMKTKC